MNFKHLTLSSLFATAPLLMVMLTAPAGCILNDDFLKAQDKFACTTTAECSEPGYTCIGGFCGIDDGSGPPCTTADQDKDGDGYGTGEDRSNCEFSQLDKDDDCAECTPIAKETCDGKDNDTNGEIDEPVACSGSSSVSCPSLDNAPAGSFWTCRNDQCVLIPPLRTPGTPCENITIACVSGAFDDTEARANNCFTQ